MNAKKCNISDKTDHIHEILITKW